MKYATRLIDANNNPVVLLQIEGFKITAAHAVTYQGKTFVYKANWTHDELTFKELSIIVDATNELEIY